MISPVAGELARHLGEWIPPTRAQDALRDEYREFIASRRSAALDRDADRSHVTASCFVFSADLSSVLLCYHKKGRFWVQQGGHIESTDTSVAAAAFREAREEAGLAVTPVSTLPLDVDRHDLGPGFVRCNVHWDVGFAGIADTSSQPTVSDESDDVQWWPVHALPPGIPVGFTERLLRIIAAVVETR